MKVGELVKILSAIDQDKGIAIEIVPDIYCSFTVEINPLTGINLTPTLSEKELREMLNEEDEENENEDY